MPDCIFCKIIRGELPSYKVYEDEKTLAFFDIRPVNAGHTLVVPKKHSTNIFDIAPEDWQAVTEAVRKIAIGIETANRLLAFSECFFRLHSILNERAARNDRAAPAMLKNNLRLRADATPRPCRTASEWREGC